MMKISPNGSRLLLRDAQVDEKKGGLILPDTALARKFEVICEVVAAGPDAGTYREGNLVYIHVNDCHPRTTELEGVMYRVIEEAKVIGRVVIEA